MVKDQSDSKGRKEMFYLTMHSTHFYLRLYGVRHMVKDQSDSKGRKEMFYLTTHSTHFYLRLYGIRHMVKDQSDSEGRKEMFYLKTHSTHFYLRLYGIRHMVKDHSDSKSGNLLPLPPHGLPQGFFYMHHPTDTDRITHTTAFVTPVVKHWLE